MNKIKPEILELTTAKWQRIISSAIESSTNAIVITDLNGKLTYVNNSFLKMWGFDDDKEVRGRRLVEFWQVKEQALKILGALRERDNWTGELTAKRKDGSNFEVDLSMNIVTDEAGKPIDIIGTFRDITGRKKVEEALHESEEKYRRFLESLADGCFAIDRNWRYVFVNDAACQFVKYTRSELLGNKITKLFPGIEDTPFFQAYKDTMDTGKTNDIEAPFPHPDGTPGHFSIRISAVPEGIIVVTRDITERKRAEEALRESESKYRSLIENIKDIVFTIDPGGKITFMSKSSEEILGYKSEEMINKNIFDFVPAEDRQRSIETIIRGMKGEKITQFQTLAITKSGNRIFVEVTVSRIWEKGVVFGALAIARDITERKRAEEQLRLLSSAVKQCSEGISVANLEGNLLFVNNAFAAMHGYDPEELVGKQLSIFHTPEQMPSVEASLQQIKETGEFSGEIWHVRQDGTGFPGLMQNSLLRDGAGNPIGIIATLRDITELKQVESALRESEVYFRTLFENIPIGVGLTSPDGKILDANNNMLEMMGYSKAEILQMNVRDAYQNPEDRSQLLEKLQANGFVRDFERELKRKDGSSFYANINVTPFNLGGKEVLLTVIRDITERKQAEERLRESESQYRLLAENITDIILTLDMNLRPTYVSSSVERLTGYIVEEVMSQTPEEILTPASFETVMKDFEEELAIEKKEQKDLSRARTLEFELKRKDGSTVWVEGKMSFLRDHNGQAVGIAGVVRDITERKWAEESLRRSEEKWHSVVENAPNFILIADRNGTIQFINRTVPGYSVEETIGTKIYDYVPPEYHNLMTETIEKVFQSGEPGKYESGVILPDSSIAWYETQVGPVKHDEQIVAVALITTDLTELKMAEEELRESEEQVKTILDSIDSAGVGICTGDIDGDIRTVNEVAVRIMGYSDEGKIIGRNISEIIPPEDQDRALKEIRRTLESDQPGLFVIQLLQDDGSTIHAEMISSLLKDKNGEPTGFLLIIRKITERK